MHQVHNDVSILNPYLNKGFPGSLAGKESTRNAGGYGSIPGLGRYPGEGIGYPLESSWASLMVQLIKNLPTMWETWVQSLHWEYPLTKGRVKGCCWTKRHQDSWPLEEKNSIQGQRRGLIHSELLCNKVLLKYKRDRESFWHSHKKGAERVPPC